MCSDCGSNPELVLECKSEALADALITVLHGEDGGALLNGRGEWKPARRDGVTVSIPWNGNPMFMVHFGEMALRIGAADIDALHDMNDAVLAAASGIPAVVLKGLRNGKTFAEAVAPVVAEPPRGQVDEMIESLTRLAAGDAADLPAYRPGDLFS